MSEYVLEYKVKPYSIGHHYPSNSFSYSSTKSKKGNDSKVNKKKGEGVFSQSQVYKESTEHLTFSRRFRDVDLQLVKVQLTASSEFKEKITKMVHNIRQVLISDPVDPICKDILEQNGLQVTYSQQWTKERLLQEIEVPYSTVYTT